MIKTVKRCDNVIDPMIQKSFCKDLSSPLELVSQYRRTQGTIRAAGRSLVGVITDIPVNGTVLFEGPLKTYRRPHA